MSCLIDVRVARGALAGEWTCCALDLPGAEIVAAFDSADTPVPFEAIAGGLRTAPRAVVARVQARLNTDLIAKSTLDDATMEFNRQKLVADDRAGRRTLWTSLATAVIAAAATIGVAVIARPDKTPSPNAPPSYRQLAECQASLKRLDDLSALPTQTLADLRTAVQTHEATCRDALRAAVESSPS